jgi:hypothetical protein
VYSIAIVAYLSNGTVFELVIGASTIERIFKKRLNFEFYN